LYLDIRFFFAAVLFIENPLSSDDVVLCDVAGLLIFTLDRDNSLGIKRNHHGDQRVISDNRLSLNNVPEKILVFRKEIVCRKRPRFSFRIKPFNGCCLFLI
jgi:hypothetical protein